MSEPIRIGVESGRAEEWREIEHGYGQEHVGLRVVEWDPTTDKIRVSGPTIVGRNRPPINPVP